MRSRLKPFIAEYIGTFALVFAGTGAIIINDVSGGTVTHVGIALTFGLVVMAMIYALGEISGAHFNPAVTGAFWLSGRFPAWDLWFPTSRPRYWEHSPPAAFCGFCFLLIRCWAAPCPREQRCNRLFWN